MITALPATKRGDIRTVSSSAVPTGVEKTVKEATGSVDAEGVVVPADKVPIKVYVRLRQDLPIENGGDNRIRVFRTDESREECNGRADSRSADVAMNTIELSTPKAGLTESSCLRNMVSTFTFQRVFMASDSQALVSL